MTLNLPAFEAQLRGFDRNQVANHIARLHHQIQLLHVRANSLKSGNAQVQAHREQLVAERSLLHRDVARRATEAAAQRRALIAALAHLRARLEQATGPDDCADRMSESITELAQWEAESHTGELREQVWAATYGRAAVREALAALQTSAMERRATILQIATEEAEQILRLAHEERSRITQQTEDAERRRREVYQRLADESERSRLAAQEVLDEQVKLAWDEDEQNRREARRRLDQRMNEAWEQCEAAGAELDQEARREAAALLTWARQEAAVVSERARAALGLLKRERDEVVAELHEIRTWIDSAAG